MGREPYAHYRHLMADDSIASVHAFRENHQGLVTAEMIARGLLPYAVVSNWNYTLHDIDHSYRVCDNINMVLDMLPDASRPDPKGIEILYQAALLHDAGMAFLSRDKERGIGVSHGELSAIFIKSISERPYLNDGFSTLGSAEQVDALCTVVRSHCMRLHKDGSDSPCFDDIDEMASVDGESVRLKMLCAVLCIADGLDIGSNRIPDTVYDILTDSAVLVTLSDIVGSQSVPYLGERSRHHWEMESHTTVDMIPESGTVIIGVGSPEEMSERQSLRTYLEYYFNILGLDVEVVIRPAWE